MSVVSTDHLLTAESEADINCIDDEHALQRFLGGTSSDVMADAVLAVQMSLCRAATVGVSEEKLRQLRFKLKSSTVVIAVVALMKAGKSTFLNSLMGEEFLPSAAQPATASITSIIHDPLMPNGRLVVEDDAGNVTGLFEGQKAINSAIAAVNEARRANPSARPTALKLKLQAPILSFGALADSGGLEVVDTPGPNEFGAGLDVEVQLVLQRTDVIFYLLDFTKIGSKDEADMFNMLRDAVLPLLDSVDGAIPRIYFILNKIDQQRRSDKHSTEAVAEKIRGYLPELKVNAGMIIPIAARHALLARQLPNHKDDPDYLDDFYKEAMGPCFKGDLTDSQLREKAVQLEGLSNIAIVENEVIRKVAKQQYVISLLTVCDHLSTELVQLSNNKTVQLAASKASLEEVAHAREMLRRTRAAITEKLEGLSTCCAKFKAETNEQAAVFFRELTTDISETIDLLMGRDSPDMECPYLKHFGRLAKAVRGLFAGGGFLEAQSREDLTRKITAAHEKVAELLGEKMDMYKHKIMASMCKKQCDLQCELSKEVQPLLNLLTGDAGRALNVELRAETVVFPDMNILDFMALTEKEMANMVKEKKEQVLKTRGKFEEKTGACGKRWTEQVGEEQYHEEQTTGYKIASADLKRVFQGQVNQQVTVSKKSTELLIEKKIMADVARVQAEVQERCQSFETSLEVQEQHKLRQKSVQDDYAERIRLEAGQLQVLETLVHRVKDAMVKSQHLFHVIPSSAQGSLCAGFLPTLDPPDFAEQCGFHLVSGSGNGLSPA